ncbi:metallophosphoesterase family protein [Deinococcus yavapaiensis]|uniref:Putative phosphodiesterase n=1 Tax=Deinococcus yavapaiensis KR-236 TaxID=694435 RepID=A0A318S363_9DEIO|nr:metallophosphoesterase family protein [Deinococcus yavapaiensis]PYE48387.1 putative phosphodiesterase [Deinococcus yavapaiensis KR-236]
MLIVRLLLVSDIHANLAAFEAVLADADRRGFDAVYCLGDALGYGPRPREVMRLLQTREASCVLGNHDAWALEFLRGEAPVRRDGVVGQALNWQLSCLTPNELEFLAQWPDGRDERVDGTDVRFRHGSPMSYLEYVDSLASAREAFGRWEGRVCCVGHTHVPGVYTTLQGPPGDWLRYQSLTAGGRFSVPPNARVILNPGSVGQPRDGDARASYGLLDVTRGIFEVVRVSYDIARTQVEVRAARLPDVLAARLEVGR